MHVQFLLQFVTLVATINAAVGKRHERRSPDATQQNYAYPNPLAAGGTSAQGPASDSHDAGDSGTGIPGPTFSNPGTAPAPDGSHLGSQPQGTYGGYGAIPPNSSPGTPSDVYNGAKNDTSRSHTESPATQVAYLATYPVHPIPSAGYDPTLVGGREVQQVYVMSKDINWTSHEFPVYNSAGEIAYTITNHINGVNLPPSQFAIIGADRRLVLTAETDSGHCGFSQHFVSSDKVHYALDPRFILTDRWYLSGSRFSPLNDHAYEFRRKSRSIQGGIHTLGTDAQHTRITTTRLGYSWVSHLIPSCETYNIYTDGAIPAPNLIALVVITETRVKKCGY